ncbi:hypothetical protein [Methanocaldococcus infernus]|uniref:Uncharacterized protein n=1 Tax=Methanocaldococcus infernus (strain DSM 11812 / JCM 15783 / ME) TaxID=573063 RepID=D5VSC3_METIM|nr:hypothetical protein [Methanocaldococcus infernus]ADG13476.1 conserved hypothetical protein [Methanocaldococcus infernus ME]
MDVYETLYNLCLEHEVKVKDKKIPLWKCKSLEEVEDLNLPWKSLRELTIYLYEVLRTQRESTEFIKFDIVKVLVGLALLREDVYGVTTEETALKYLSQIITYRMNILARYYYLIKKPINTSIFEDIILKFPQNRDIRTSNIEDLKILVEKIKKRFKP